MKFGLIDNEVTKDIVLCRQMGTPVMEILKPILIKDKEYFVSISDPKFWINGKKDSAGGYLFFDRISYQEMYHRFKLLNIRKKFALPEKALISDFLKLAQYLHKKKQL